MPLVALSLCRRDVLKYMPGIVCRRCAASNRNAKSCCPTQPCGTIKSMTDVCPNVNRLWALEGTASRTYVMGILNATPDSFSDGGQHAGVEEAVRHALSMARQGADVIDIGGESTRQVDAGSARFLRRIPRGTE